MDMRTSKFVFALALASAPSFAQQPDEGANPPPIPPPTPSIAPPQDDVQRQMIELFGKVERQMQAIDRLLQEASRASNTGSGGSIAEQLRNAQTSGESVQRDIDRILELAAQQNQNSSSSSSSSSQGQGQPSSGQGENPMNRQGEQSTGRESTPSMPERGDGSPQPNGREKGGEAEKPGPDGQKPGEEGRKPSNGPDASKADPHQAPGSDPGRGAQGAPSSASDARDRWGDLPTHAREVFRNEGGRDMPPMYREWIDAYYRRLNKKP